MSARVAAHGGGRRAPDRRRRRRATIALLVWALVAGCSALAPDAREAPVLHVLQTERTGPPAERRGELVLEVSAPRAAPGYETSRFAYVDRRYAIEYYTRSEWADAPARMLEPLLVRALDDSGAFRAVVPAPTTIRTTLRLDVELVRLHQDFTRTPSAADVGLRVQLVDPVARRVVATTFIDETEPAPTQDATGGVIAANVALGRALARVVAFVVSHAEARRPPPG